jgi:hypothetical protein
VLYTIDEVLEDMAFEGRTHFSPHYVAARAGLHDLKAVTEYLFSLVGTKLIVYFEVECPDGDSDYAVKSPSDIIFEPRNCSICNITYTPSPDRVWIAFDFVSQYIDYVKKKRENKDVVLV